MKRTNKLIGNADGRPRIHIWQGEQGVGWSKGFHGLLHPAPDAGAAVNEALDSIGRQPAVIIWEGRV